MKPKQSAKKTKGVGRRASENDLAPRESQDAKGGFLGGIGKGIKGVVKGVAPIVLR